MSDDFLEPSDAGNFLQRYHEARASRSAPSSPNMTAKAPPSPQSPQAQVPPLSPPSPRKTPTQTRKEAAKTIWESVFHPLGRSSTTADRYDLSKGQVSRPGMSVSEVHAMGSGISLDAKNDD